LAQFPLHLRPQRKYGSLLQKDFNRLMMQLMEVSKWLMVLSFALFKFTYWYRKPFADDMFLWKRHDLSICSVKRFATQGRSHCSPPAAVV